MNGDMFTIKGRLLEVQRAVVLLHAGIVAIEHEHDSDAEINAVDIAAALEHTAAAASAHLYWLSLLPESVLHAPCPEDTQANEGAPEGESTDESRRRMVETAIRQAFPPMPDPEHARLTKALIQTAANALREPQKKLKTPQRKRAGAK